MPRESFPAPVEQPEEKQKEELLPTGKSRRKFLKMAGTVAGGLVVAADVAESLMNVKRRYETREKNFSWPELNREIENIKNQFGEKWPQEAKQRIERGVDQYFVAVAKESIGRQRTEKSVLQRIPELIERDFPKTQGEIREGLGLLLGITASVAYDWFKKLKGGSEQLSGLDYTNKILLFGSAGAGVGLLLEKIEELSREKDPSAALQRLKQYTIDLALRAISLQDEENAPPKTMEAFEDLADTITQNIADHDEYLQRVAKPQTMLEYWGIGAAMISLPTSGILQERERRATKGV